MQIMEFGACLYRTPSELEVSVDKLSAQLIESKKDQNWMENEKNKYLPNMRTIFEIE